MATIDRGHFLAGGYLRKLGLFAPKNASVFVALALGALSVAAAIYLVVELDQPYSGFISFPGQICKPRWNSLTRLT